MAAGDLSASISQSASEPKSAAPAVETKAPQAKKEKVWTAEAVSNLAKALAKFPGGTRNRWQAIAAYLLTTGFEATEDECIAAAKTIGQAKPVHGAVVIGAGGAATTTTTTANDEDTDTGAPWSIESLKALEAALLEFPAGQFEDKVWKVSIRVLKS